jgi:hypothetical protein
VQKAFNRTPAIPLGLDIEKLESSRRIMNKLMMNYVD